MSYCFKKEGTESYWLCGEVETALTLKQLPGGETLPDIRVGLAEEEAKKSCRAARGQRDCSLRSSEQSQG